MAPLALGAVSRSMVHPGEPDQFDFATWAIANGLPADAPLTGVIRRAMA